MHAADWANWLGIATGLGALLLWLAAGSRHRHACARSPSGMLFVLLALAGGLGSSWLATVLWNVASQRLSASLCGQLIVSETLFALLYSFLWDGRWPHAIELAAALLFVLGILASDQGTPMRIEIPEVKKLVYEMTIPIRWGDMDAMGHLNNTSYFRYLETARIDWFHSLGAEPDAERAGHGDRQCLLQLLQAARIPGRRAGEDVRERPGPHHLRELGHHGPRPTRPR